MAIIIENYKILVPIFYEQLYMEGPIGSRREFLLVSRSGMTKQWSKIKRGGELDF